MILKFPKSPLRLIVASISVFVAMAAVEAYAVQDLSKEVRANAFIPLAKPSKVPDSPEQSETSESEEGFPFTDPHERELSEKEVRLLKKEAGIQRRLSELREDYRKISQGLVATTPYKSKMLETKIELLESQLTAIPHRQSLYQNEIQLLLYDKIEQRKRLRENYEDSHPSIKKLDAQIELLKTKLKAETESSALDHEKSKLAQFELQKKLELAEEAASRSASLLRSDDFKDEQSKNGERLKLQNAVQKLFDLRMHLQTAQLDDAEAKLAASRQRLVRRQSLAKKIVQRRVNELLNTDETKWGTQPSDAQKFVSPQSKPDSILFGILGSNSESAASVEIKTLANACKMYKLNVGAFPAKLQDLSQLPSGLSQAQWGGPYLNPPILNDPWKRPYKYSPNNENNTILIQSAGPNGEFGTSDDLSNAQAIAESGKGRWVGGDGSWRFPAEATSPPSLVDPMHKVRPGDVLGIFVPGVFDEIDSKFTGIGSGYPIHVKSDGRISLPIAGRVKVAGKTVLEIENEVKDKYVEGTNPIIREQDRDKISVVVQQVYEPSARANSGRGLPSLVDPLHKVKAGDLLSIFAPHVFDGRNRGPTSPGYPIYVKSDGQISLPLIGRLKVAGKTALDIEDEVKKKYADGPDPIFEEEYRDSISVSVYQAYKPAVRKSISVSRLDDQDAAQLAAQTFLNLYFSGDIEKATELTNNPRPLKTLREFVDSGTNAAPKVNGFSGGRIQADISTDGIVQLKKALPRTARTQATLIVRMEKNDSDGWRVLQVFMKDVITARRKATLSSTPNQSEYKGLLGKWEVVSIKGKGGKFMTLDDSTKIGDTLLIPHYEYRSRQGDQRELVVKSKWLSDEIKASWTKNDSLRAQPSDRPKQLTYRGENGEKYHLGDSEDPPEFAIYQLDEDELTLVAGDPEDFTVDKNKVRILADDKSGEFTEVTRIRLRPNYAKDFYLPPDERQLWVKLRRVDSTIPPAASPIKNTDVVKPFFIGKDSEEPNLPPFKILFEKGSKTPVSLLRNTTESANGANGFPKYEPWAAAEPVDAIRGRWRAKKFFIKGKEIATDSAMVKKLKMSRLIAFGTMLLAEKPNGPDFYMYAYPNVPDAAILVDRRKPTRTKSFRFSVDGDKLKVAIWSAYNKADPPSLTPNDDVIFIEYERKPAEPGFFPVGNKPAPSELVPYTLLFENGGEVPDWLSKKVSRRGAIAKYQRWAAAEPVKKLQGRWRATMISIDGKEVALDSDPAKTFQMSKLLVDGKMLSASKPDGPKFFMLAYPEIPDAAILIALGDSTRTTLLRHSIDGDKLKVAISNVCNQVDVPPLKPSDSIVFVEYERAPKDPALNPKPAVSSASTAPAVSDASGRE